MRYADPSLCPGCRSDLPQGVTSCPTCSLPVRHPVAVELFATLKQADVLLERLRSVSAAPVSPTPVPSAPVPRAPLPGYPTPTPPPRPAGPAPDDLGRTGVGVAAVPKILLGLGALCLLVAAIVFLAVSWSLLGVGGRTAVLVSLTAAAGGAALLLHRIELRIAAESLSVVALGMVGLDVVGAEAAGWFGSVSDELTVAIAGVVIVVAGTGLALPRFTDRPRLVAPQVAAAIGFLAAYAGFVADTSHDLVAGHLLVTVGGCVVLLARHHLPVQMWGFLMVTACVWFATTMIGLVDAFTDPSLDGLWREDGAGWSLLLSAAALVVPGAVLRRRDVSLIGGSVSALLMTTTLTLPVVDESAQLLGTVALAVTAAWTIAYRVLPRLLRPVAIAPASIGSLILLGLTGLTAAVALTRVAEIGADSPFDVVLRRPDPVTEPLLTVPSALVPLALLAFLLPGTAGGSRAATWWQVGGVTGGLAAAATLASYDVPLLAVVGLLAAVTAGTLACGLLATGERQTWFGLASLGLAGITLLVSLPSTPLIAVAAGAALATAAAAHLLGRTTELILLAGTTMPPALAILVWATGSANHVDAAWLGVPALALVGLLAIVRPRLEIEIPAILTAVVASAPSIDAAGDPGGSLALHLTLAGCLVTATALIHPSRREAAYAGAALLLLATWVRLGDLGVTAPEPYTLPLALGLVTLGAVHLHRDPRADTATALIPGLALGTVPSLLWVLDDPLSLRALLLGAGCLVLTIVGAMLRWSAPLLVGSAVGAALVVREISPYAADVPQWVWIGLAGGLLITVGISWERRLVEVRKAVGLLGRLR